MSLAIVVEVARRGVRALVDHPRHLHAVHGEGVVAVGRLEREVDRGHGAVGDDHADRRGGRVAVRLDRDVVRPGQKDAVVVPDVRIREHRFALGLDEDARRERGAGAGVGDQAGGAGQREREERRDAGPVDVPLERAVGVQLDGPIEGARRPERPVVNVPGNRVPVPAEHDVVARRSGVCVAHRSDQVLVERVLGAVVPRPVHVRRDRVVGEADREARRLAQVADRARLRLRERRVAVARDPREPEVAVQIHAVRVLARRIGQAGVAVRVDERHEHDLGAVDEVARDRIAAVAVE
jgi:hypothetical protein